jgi:nucleoside-diphosphate kinase
MNRTFAMIKPIWGDHYRLRNVLAFIENHEFTIETLHRRCLALSEVDVLYREHVGKSFYETMRTYMCSGPVVGMLLSHRQGDVLARWRRALGATDSSKADPGTLRALYSNKIGVIFQNVAHGSDAPDAAFREAGLWGWHVR